MPKLRRQSAFTKLLFLSLLIAAPSLSAQDPAPEDKTLSIGTLNAEFLNFKKIHLKYKFEQGEETFSYPFFLKPGDDSREKLIWSGLTSPGRGAKTFFEKFDTDEAFRRAVLLWGDDDYRANRLKESSAEIAGIIKELDTDILVLTEVGARQDLDVLLNELASIDNGYEYSAICDCSDNATYQKVAILSRHPILSTEPKVDGREGFFQEADDDDSEKSTGISKGLRSLIKVDDEFLFVYGVHFKSERGFSEADGQRIAQASIVRRSYLPLLDTCVAYKNRKVKTSRKSTDGSCPRGSKQPHIVVAGDLNEKRGQPALRRVRGLDDIAADLLQTGHQDYFDRDKEDTRWTYEYIGVRNQIDHILLSPSMKKFGGSSKAKLATSTLIHGNHKATDHNGLKVSVTYKEQD